MIGNDPIVTEAVRHRYCKAMERLTKREMLDVIAYFRALYAEKED